MNKRYCKSCGAWIADDGELCANCKGTDKTLRERVEALKRFSSGGSLRTEEKGTYFIAEEVLALLAAPAPSMEEPWRTVMREKLGDAAVREAAGEGNPPAAKDKEEGMKETCTRCGCTKPCACDNYTPDRQSTCVRCGCTKPCGCDGYTRREPKEATP